MHSAKWCLSSHIKSGKLGVKPLTTVHTTLRDTIAKSTSPLLPVLPPFHLSLTHMDLRYTKAGKAKLIENKTGEQPLGTPTPAFVDGRKIVENGTDGSETSGAFP